MLTDALRPEGRGTSAKCDGYVGIDVLGLNSRLGIDVLLLVAEKKKTSIIKDCSKDFDSPLYEIHICK